MEKPITLKGEIMYNLIKKLVIFIPAFCAIFSALMILKPNAHGFVVIFLTISCIAAIAFYYAIQISITDRMVNQFRGNVITLGARTLKCSCGANAVMIIAENIDNEDDVRVVIQCSSSDCCQSVQGTSPSQAERGWAALCGN